MNRICKNTIALGVMLAANICISHAQDFEEWKKQETAQQKQFMQQHNATVKQMQAEYNAFVAQAENEFAEFLKDEWKSYQSFVESYNPSKPKPKETPTYTEKKEPQKLQIREVKTIESSGSMPHLIPSSRTNNAAANKQAELSFFGTNISVFFDSQIEPKLSKINEQNIGNEWTRLCGTNYQATIEQLTSLRNNLSLNDWGYYLLTKATAEQISASINNSTLLTWFLLTKSGYRCRVAYKDEALHLLLASKNNIYGKPFFTFSNTRYYLFDSNDSELYTYDKDFAEAHTLFDLNIYKALNISENEVSKKVSFEYDGEKREFDVKYNQNLIDFYKQYPLGNIEVYFDAAISPCTQISLYNALHSAIKDLDEIEAANLLLHFVQTAFKYKTDDDQFGCEKFFFADELFHYEFSDCEDRSVLFSYLVKQLLGLETVGLNYPGHMATAVKFSKQVPGDHIIVNGEQYTVCDPTYINAPVGCAMPEYANVSAIVVKTQSRQCLAKRSETLWRIANKYGLYQGSNNNNITFDKKGNAYICGYFNGDVNFFGWKLKSNQNSSDVFIAKIGTDFNVEYVIKVGGKGDDIAYNIVMGSDDSFYFSGAFNNDIAVNGKTLKAGDKGDIFLAKCSTAGQIQWINKADIAQIDSMGSAFVASFDNRGKKLWTRSYSETEDNDNYGIMVDENGTAFLSASLLASAGLRIETKNYEAQRSAFAASRQSEDYTAPEIMPALKFANQIHDTQGSLSGKSALETLLSAGSNTGQETFKNISNAEFLCADNRIAAIRTYNGVELEIGDITISNNAKIKVTVFGSGNVQIDIMSGGKLKNENAVSTLNSIKLYKTSGNITLDYDNSHFKKNLNARNIM